MPDIYYSFSDPDFLADYINLLINTESFGDDVPESPSDQEEEDDSEDDPPATDPPGDDSPITIIGDGGGISGPQIGAPGPGIPDAPTGVRLSPGERARGEEYLDLSWQAPGNDGGSPISNYWVQVYDNLTCDGDSLKELPTETASQNGRVPNLEKNTPHFFKVAAENGVGRGPFSDCSSEIRTLDESPFAENEGKFTPPVFSVPVKPSTPSSCLDPVPFLIREGNLTKNSAIVSVDNNAICFTEEDLSRNNIFEFIVHVYDGTLCRGTPDSRSFRTGSFDITESFSDFYIENISDEDNRQFSFKVSFNARTSNDSGIEHKGLGCIDVTLPDSDGFGVYIGEHREGEESPYISDNVDKYQSRLGDILQVLGGSFIACGIPAVAAGPLSAALAKIGIAVQPVDDIGGNIKECVLDVFVSDLARDVLLAIAQDYSEYALSGFDSEQPFFTDQDRYIENLLDDAAGRSLDRHGLGFLCEVNQFNLDISGLLQLKYRNIVREKPRCRATEAYDNAVLLKESVEETFSNIDDLVVSSVEFVNEGDFHLYDEPARTVRLDLKGVEGAGVDMVSKSGLGETRWQKYLNGTESSWNVYTSTDSGRRHPHLLLRASNVTQSLNDIGKNLEEWYADPDIHYVLAEQPLYHSDNTNTAYTILARLHLKTSSGHQGGDLTNFLGALREQGLTSASRESLCGGNCEQSVQGNNWCITAAVGETVTGGNWIDNNAHEWSYRANPEEGKYVSISMEKDLSWLRFKGGEVTEEVSNNTKVRVCDRRTMDAGDSDLYAQILLLVRPSESNISKPGDGKKTSFQSLNRPRYGVSGSSAYFDINNSIDGFRTLSALWDLRGSKKDKPTEEAIDRSLRKAVDEAREETVSDRLQGLEKELRVDNVAEARKVAENAAAGTINIYKECDSIENEKEKGLCVRKVTEATEINKRLYDNDERILARAKHADEFKEILVQLFKNTVVGLAKRAKDGTKNYEEVVERYKKTRGILTRSSTFNLLEGYQSMIDRLFNPSRVSSQKDQLLSPLYQLTRAQVALRDSLLILHFMKQNINRSVVLDDPGAFSWFNRNNSRQKADLTAFGLASFIEAVQDGNSTDGGNTSERVNDLLNRALVNYPTLGYGNHIDYDRAIELIDKITREEERVNKGWRYFDDGDDNDGNNGRDEFGNYFQNVMEDIAFYKGAYEDTIEANVTQAKYPSPGDNSGYDKFLRDRCRSILSKRGDIGCADLEGGGGDVSPIISELLFSAEAPMLIKAVKKDRGGGYDRSKTIEKMNRFTEECSVRQDESDDDFEGNGDWVTSVNSTDYFRVKTAAIGNIDQKYIPLRCTVKEFGEYVRRKFVEKMARTEYLVRFLYSSVEDDSKLFEMPIGTLEELVVKSVRGTNEDFLEEQRIARKPVENIFVFEAPKRYGPNFYFNVLGRLRDPTDAVTTYNTYLQGKVDRQYQHNASQLHTRVGRF